MLRLFERVKPARTSYKVKRPIGPNSHFNVAVKRENTVSCFRIPFKDDERLEGESALSPLSSRGLTSDPTSAMVRVSSVCSALYMESNLMLSSGSLNFTHHSDRCNFQVFSQVDGHLRPIKPARAQRGTLGAEVRPQDRRV